MKIKYISFIWVLFAMFVSCKHTANDTPEIKCVTLDVSISNELPSMSKEFTDFEIIPLENKKEAILSDVRKMIVTDAGMYFWDANPMPQVFRFSPKGTFINCIGKRGHAKGEFQTIMNIAATRQGDSIAILTYPDAYLYNENGKFFSSLKIIDDKGTEDMLFTNDGIFCGYFHRQEKSLMTFYSKDMKLLANIVETSCNPFGESLGVANGHLLQQDDNNVYCLDVFSSCFYVLDKNNPKNIIKYSFGLDNMLTEEKARKEEGDKCYRIYSYQVYKGVVRGVIEYDKGFYDFQFSISDNKVSFTNHKELDFAFDCSHNGYFYKIVSASNLLEFMDTEKIHKDAIRHLLGEALTTLNGKVSSADNYYIIKMRVKE